MESTSVRSSTFDDTRFSCKECDASFATNRVLRRHMENKNRVENDLKRKNHEVEVAGQEKEVSEEMKKREREVSQEKQEEEEEEEEEEVALMKDINILTTYFDVSDEEAREVLEDAGGDIVYAVIYLYNMESNFEIKTKKV